MLAASFGAISLEDGRKWVRFPSTTAEAPETGERVRRRLESHFGRMIRPGTVGTYPQLTPHYLTYCRNLCILST